MSSTIRRKARVIAVTSGKGGVGKTNVSVNLAVALARAGRRAMLVDCDIGMANANILLGVEANFTMGDLVAGGMAVRDVALAGPAGLALVPGHSGLGLGGALGQGERARLAEAFRPHAGDYDHVVVDTGGGLMGDGLAQVAASDLVLLVLGPEPTAFMDAYALVKALSLRHGCMEIGVLANMVAREAEGMALFRRFEAVVDRFLPVHLDYLGAVPEDRSVRDAVHAKRCCVEAYPAAPASIAFRRLAERIAARDLPMMTGGNRFFGMEAVHGAH